MTLAASPDIAALNNIDRAMVRQIANLDPGWHSAPDIAWQIVGGSYEERSRVKQTCSELYRAGYLERLYVQHADRPMSCYKIDPGKLWALAAELDR